MLTCLPSLYHAAAVACIAALVVLLVLDRRRHVASAKNISHDGASGGCCRGKRTQAFTLAEAGGGEVLMVHAAGHCSRSKAGGRASGAMPFTQTLWEVALVPRMLMNHAANQ